MAIFGWLRRLTTLRKEAAAPVAPTLPAFKAAGCLFTDGHHVLAGYQPRKVKPFMSGIGGARKWGEPHQDTAIREMVEEIFEPLYEVPPAFYEAILENVKPRASLQSGGYVCLVFTFKDLEKILKIAGRYRITSRVYRKLPKTLLDLLGTRDASGTADWKPEITQFGLLPLVAHPESAPFVAPEFLEDMKFYLEMLEAAGRPQPQR